MATVKGEIEIEVFCEKCRNGLDFVVRRNTEIYVDPCETCLLDEYNKGYDERNSKEE